LSRVVGAAAGGRAPPGGRGGSSPKPPGPDGAWRRVPVRRPSTTRSVPSGRARAAAQAKWAPRCSSAMSESWARSRSRLARSSPWVPAQRAEKMPGAPPRTSTQRPESSATAGRPVARARAWALRRAFSAKVTPVSLTSGTSGWASAPTSSWGRPASVRIDRSSVILPALRVARIRRVMGSSIQAGAGRPSRRADLGEFTGRVGDGADVGGLVAVLDGGADVVDGLVEVVDGLADVGVVGLVGQLVEVLVDGREGFLELGDVVGGVVHGLLHLRDAVGDGVGGPDAVQCLVDGGAAGGQSGGQRDGRQGGGDGCGAASAARGHGWVLPRAGRYGARGDWCGRAESPARPFTGSDAAATGAVARVGPGVAGASYASRTVASAARWASARVVQPATARSRSASSSSRAKGSASAVPWTSMKRPSPVHTTFMSVSARTSSS